MTQENGTLKATLPGVLRDKVLGLVGRVSVLCGGARSQVLLSSSISMWQHAQLSE